MPSTKKFLYKSVHRFLLTDTQTQKRQIVSTIPSIVGDEHLPEKLTATIESNETQADAFPWRSVENQRRALFVSFRFRIAAVADAADAVGGGRDVARTNNRHRLLPLTLASLRTQHFTRKLLRVALLSAHRIVADQKQL